MNEARKEIFSYKIPAGARTYFFDIKETKDGGKYLVISESRKKESGYEHNRIMVFEENVQSFSEGLHKAVRFLRGD